VDTDGFCGVGISCNEAHMTESICSCSLPIVFLMKQEGEPLPIIYLNIKVTKNSTADQETKKVR
jgi:hypothetical protein